MRERKQRKTGEKQMCPAYSQQKECGGGEVEVQQETDGGFAGFKSVKKYISKNLLYREFVCAYVKKEIFTESLEENPFFK